MNDQVRIPKPVRPKATQMPPVPDDIQQYVFVDQTGRVAFGVKDMQKNHQRAFRSYVALLKTGGFIDGGKVIEAKSFHIKKKQVLASGDDENSQMQAMVVDLFQKAAELNSSDIHIVDHGSYGEVLFRLNGDLTHIQQLPEEIPTKLFYSVYTSMTDQAESTFKRKQPQKGRIGEKKFLPKSVHSIRVEYCPISGGAFMVFRLLYKSDDVAFEKLGYSEKLGQQSAIRLMQRRPAGIILVAGPTGSGKSTTLKHILTGMKKQAPEMNFVSVEDPPEYPMPEVRQIPVITEAQASYDQRLEAYNRVLESILRLDPDLIMQGEIRDKASAEFAIQGALTGHPVWTTLHASNPFNILTRLIRKLERPNALEEIADVGIISGLIFQKLVQTLCDHCKLPLVDNIDRIGKGLENRLVSRLDITDPAVCKAAIKGDGCAKCRNTGVSGRTLLAEVVVPDHQIMEQIISHGVGYARRSWIKDHPGQSIIDHAFEKIADGIIDPVAAEKALGPLTMDAAFADRILDKKEIKDLAAA